MAFRITRKKVKKNIPYLFIFLAIGLVVGYRAYQQMRPAVFVPVPYTEEQKEYMSHKIANAPYYTDTENLDTLPYFGFIEIGKIHNDANNTAVFEPSLKIPKPGKDPIFPVLTIAEPLPSAIETSELAGKAIGQWRSAGHDIDGVFIKYDVDHPDFSLFNGTAKKLKKELGSINLVLRRSWFESATGLNDVSNIGKYARIYAYDIREAGRPDESLATTILKLDDNKLSFYLIVDKRPDLSALRAEIGEPGRFMGVAYRDTDYLKVKPENSKK